MKFNKLFALKKRNQRESRANAFVLESLESRLLLSATPMTAAVVTTDHLDYAPGETAVITTSNTNGEGLQFGAGELVRFQVNRTDGMADHVGSTADVGPAGNEAWYVVDGVGGFSAYLGSDVSGDGVADWIAPDNDNTMNGSISSTWFVEEQYRDSSLLVTAIGQELGAVASQAFTDAKINTTTTVSSSTATSIYGDVVTFTATVKPAVGKARPTGSVEFFDGAISLGVDYTAGKGSGSTSIFTISISNLTAGTHAIHAVFTDGAWQEPERAGSEQHDRHDHRDRPRERDAHRHDGWLQENHRRGHHEFHHHGHAQHESLKHHRYNSSTSGNLEQTVRQKSLTGSFTVENKVYDGNASVTVQTQALVGVIASDDVSMSGGTATFDNANAGNGKTVTLTGAVLTGAAAGNYSLAAVDTTTANITKANATLVLTGYYGTYDAMAHQATGTATGVLGESLAGLNLSVTSHTNAGTYTDTVTYTDVTGNYKDTIKNVKSYILQASVTVTGDGLNGSGYFGTYDGQAHAATATVTGVGGMVLGQVVSSTTHTNAGTYTDTVTYTDVMGNYKDTIKNIKSYILQASVTLTVTGYSMTFDGTAHTAIGTVTGVNGEDLSAGLDLSSTTHTNVGTYLDVVTFTDVTGNYKNIVKSVNSRIL